MCIVTRRGSPCAHCRNINGIFNCFWLRSVGWVWVKPISRLEETVKNCLWKKALTFWQTGYAVVCYCTRNFLIYVHIMWDYGSIFPYVCMWVLFCLCASVCMWESECPLSSGKKMPYGISDYMLQWCTVCPPPPPETESPGHCKSIWRLESDPELWSDLEPKQREKPCRETNSLVLCDLCGVEFHPLFCTVKSVSRWRGTLSVKFKMHFTNVKLHTVCEVDFCLYHVCHCVLCHWDSFLHIYWIWHLK